MNLSIPVRSFFAVATDCPKLETTSFMKRQLTGWPEANRLPDLQALEGQAAFADVYLGWRDDGLYLGVHVNGDAGLGVQPKSPLKGDGVQVWVDTRDVRDVHRASRFCHHFYFLPTGGRDEAPLAGQVRVRRARAQGRPCDPQLIEVASHIGKRGYRLSARLPAEVLHGFDPADNARMGFTYVVKDREIGRQSWTAEEALPVAYDPSLWGSVVLVP